MAKRKSAPVQSAPSKPKAARRKSAPAVQMHLGAEEIKRLLKAPGDYHDIAQKFAAALEMTNFRGPFSPQKLRSMVDRGRRLGQLADELQLKATAADQRRMVQDSQAWRSLLSSWRQVQAAMPDRPEFEEPFAFMQEYMSPGRSSVPPTPTPPKATP